MNSNIFYSVNCGLFFWNGARGLLVDGIHTGTEQGFSAMPEMLRKNMLLRKGIFAHTDNLLFTHQHKDHFDAEQVQNFLGTCSPYVYAPAFPQNNVHISRVSPKVELLKLDQYNILSFHTTHDAKLYCNIPHQSYLIRTNGESVFVAGDMTFQDFDIMDFFDFFGSGLSAVFMNPFQLLQDSGKVFLERAKPNRVFLYHLPFPEDNDFMCNTIGGRVVRDMPKHLPPVERIPHMSWIDGRVPDWV